MRLKNYVAAMLVLALLTWAPALAAQTKAPAKGKTGDKTAMRQRAPMTDYGIPKACADQLNLTASQKTKLKAINQKFSAEVRKLLAPEANKDQRRSKMMQLRQQRQKDVAAVLTDAQEKKLKDCIAKQRKEHPRRDEGKNKAKAKPAARPKK